MSIQLDRGFRLASVQSISSHCWSPDRSFLAIVPNSNEIFIYQQSDPGKWSLAHSLDLHSQKVTGMDWASMKDENGDIIHRIVTCSEDRNAFVWTFSANNFKSIRHELVITRLMAGATMVRWSPSGKKFAISSVSPSTPMAICYWDDEANFWNSRLFSKEEILSFGSGVLTFAWHPSSVLLGIGTINSSVFVISTFVKGIDQKPDDCSMWGDKFPFGTLCMALKNENQCWINSIVFSPCGSKLAVADNVSGIYLLKAGEATALCLNGPDSLPYLSLLWIEPSIIIAAGYGPNQVCYFYDEKKGLWYHCHLHRREYSLDKRPMENSSAEKKERTLSSSAFSKFKSLVMTGQEKPSLASHSTSDMYPASTINELRSYSNGSAFQYSSSSIDGVIAIWSVSKPSEEKKVTVDSLSFDMIQLKINEHYNE